MVAMGSAQEAAAAVTAHLDAGADHVVMQILTDESMVDPRPALRELAPALHLE